MKKVWIIMISGLQKKLKKQWMMNPKRFLFYEFEDGKKSKKVLEYILSISIAGKREVETFKREDDSFGDGTHKSCIIYDLYMKLEYLLCSWDPSKRPTAMEALQHPFFQSCYYIPPSLGSKAPTPRMSPSGMFMVLDNSYIPAEPTIHDSVLVIVYAVGLNGMRAIEHNCTTGYSVFLPNVKQTNNVISSAKVRAFVSADTVGTLHAMLQRYQLGDVC
ncbi:cyclin-dependent kinase F-4-like protein isoform X1 [Tanacetum coccineum]|uniref:Cyclin-dependent kinase F-4-like protein isoform X1 n=1 Tax=Tanacetum coccineum TaxID=301880 RepID=A0ABQ4WK61_9ASTR